MGHQTRLTVTLLQGAIIISAIIIDAVVAFAPSVRPRQRSALWATSVESAKEAKVGDLLGTLPTPSLMVELSLMEKYLQENGATCSVEDFLADPKGFEIEGALEDIGPLFIHTRVTSTAKREAVVAKEGSGKSLSVCDVDTCVESVAPGGAYLGLGLANHHVGGYYWARSMGIGASLPAHGIYFGPSDSDPLHGELFWKKRGPGDPAETTEESSNSNDGKRSEWADFLQVGDTVQLVPHDPLSILASEESSPYQFNILLGIRRAGRPLGADPIVEKVWVRANEGDRVGWDPQQ